MGEITGLDGSFQLKYLKIESFLLQDTCIQFGGIMAIKTYVLEVIFDEETDECIGLREYVEQDQTILKVDDEKIKLDDKLGKLLDSSIMGVS